MQIPRDGTSESVCQRRRRELRRRLAGAGDKRGQPLVGVGTVGAKTPDVRVDAVEADQHLMLTAAERPDEGAESLARSDREITAGTGQLLHLVVAAHPDLVPHAPGE